MKIKDTLILLWKIIQKNKRLFTITTVIIVFLSFISLSLMSISISYTNNLYNMNYKLIEYEGASISISKSYTGFENDEIDYILNEVSRYDTAVSNTYARSSYAYYYDFNHMDYTSLGIVDTQYIYKNSNYAFINSNVMDYSINDVITVNSIDYIVGGYYVSDYMINPICDLTYSKEIDLRLVIVEFNKDVFSKGNLKDFGQLYSNLSNLESNTIDLYSYNYDNFIKEKNNILKNNYLLLTFEVILLLFMIGIVYNAFSIIHVENDNFFTLLRTIGCPSFKVRLLEMLEFLFAFLSSIILANIIILVLNPLFKKIVVYLIKLINLNKYEEVEGLYSISYNYSILPSLILIFVYGIISFVFTFGLTRNKKIIDLRGE